MKRPERDHDPFDTWLKGFATAPRTVLPRPLSLTMAPAAAPPSRLGKRMIVAQAAAIVLLAAMNAWIGRHYDRRPPARSADEAVRFLKAADLGGYVRMNAQLWEILQP